MSQESTQHPTTFDRALVVANPFSGSDKNRLDGSEALVRIAPMGVHAELGWTERAGHATELARAWAAGGGDLVVAVGGDGTVHEVARGLVGTSCAMAVLPSGSGNDFASGVGCASISRGLQAVAHGRDIPVDVCALDDLVFINSCGLFASGLVSGAASRYWRWLGGNRYTVAAARTLMSYGGQHVQWSFKTPGLDQPDMTLQGKILLAEICNGPLTGGGFRFAPDASLTDGLLDAALIQPMSLWAGLKLLTAASSGQRLDHPAVSVHQASEISFESNEAVAYHIDGEPSVLPAGQHTIRVLAEKLLVRMIRET